MKLEQTQNADMVNYYEYMYVVMFSVSIVVWECICVKENTELGASQQSSGSESEWNIYLSKIHMLQFCYFLWGLLKYAQSVGE